MAGHCCQAAAAGCRCCVQELQQLDLRRGVLGGLRSAAGAWVRPTPSCCMWSAHSHYTGCRPWHHADEWLTCSHAQHSSHGLLAAAGPNIVLTYSSSLQDQDTAAAQSSHACSWRPRQGAAPLTRVTAAGSPPCSRKHASQSGLRCMSPAAAPTKHKVATKVMPCGQCTQGMDACAWQRCQQAYCASPGHVLCAALPGLSVSTCVCTRKALLPRATA